MALPDFQNINALLGTIALIGGAVLGIWRLRKTMIESMRRDLAIYWTNGGDVNPPTPLEGGFLHLTISLSHGE